MPIQKVTKEEIIRKAIEVFHKQGYHPTSMSDLAQACGLRKGSFYHHFASKEELMHAVLLAVRNYYQKRIFSIANDTTLGARDRLIKIWEEQKHTLSHRFGGCLFGNMALETANVTAEFREQLRAFFDDWVQTLTQLFAVQYPNDRARQLAQQSVMLMEGAAMMARLYEDDSYLETAVESVLAHFPAN